MSGHSRTPGVKPITVVDEDGEISVEDLAKRVLQTRADHDDILQAYHKVWYEAQHTWHYTHFLGVGMMKSPNDLWMYQALMTNHRPQVVIETGTYTGASALWIAVLMDWLGIENGRIFTIDFEDHRKHPIVLHPRITYLAGDSTNPEIRDAIAAEVGKFEEAHTEGGHKPFPILISLDADHSAEHVRKELELYAPMCEIGDWLVVEDTNILSAGEDGDRGAAGGLQDYVDKHPGEFRQDVLCERYLTTMNPGGWLQRMRECYDAF